ncbi:hypothetical protein Q8F55_008983 [Vanrija albida]|uniref:Integral membrane protein n=1 Tax=Vanrija albida TaxID=181172 RepID=A0ABR3PT88_9TREE
MPDAAGRTKRLKKGEVTAADGAAAAGTAPGTLPTPLQLALNANARDNAVQSFPKWIHPTTLHFTDHNGNRVAWHSRRARKARYSRKHYHVNRDDTSQHSVHLRMPHHKGVLKPHLWGDISFWEAVVFTFGSVIWVVNGGFGGAAALTAGFLVFLPYLYPNVGRHGIQNAASWIGFAGGLVFVIGAHMMVIEALDRGRENNFGTSLKRLLSGQPTDVPATIAPAKAAPAKAGSATTSSPATGCSTDASSTADSSQPPSPADPERAERDLFPWREEEPGFKWFGWESWRNVGFLAAFTEWWAATIFWVATISGLPAVINGKRTATRDVFIWTPQVIGGVGFVITSLLQMLEVQHKWYIPRPMDIGWQIGFWNLIGGTGFLLCGALGYAASSHKAMYQSELATFWASWAYVIASCLQLYESVWREPPDED